MGRESWEEPSTEYQFPITYWMNMYEETKEESRRSEQR